MAEDCHSDKMSNVVRKDFLSGSTTKPRTEAVQPLAMQPEEAIDLHIPDEKLSTKSDAVAENRQAIDISPGVFDTYAIPYICKDDGRYAKKSSEETKTEATILASNSSHNGDMNLAGSVTSENDSNASVFIRNDSHAHTRTRNTNPMYTQTTVDHPPNDVTSNPMYTQSTMDVTPNLTYTQSTVDPSPNNVYSNPMYLQSSNELTQSTVDPSPNNVNSNPMYLQSSNELKVSPRPTFKSDNIDDNRCPQPSADTRQQGDEVTFISANSDGSLCIQPFDVTRQKDDDKESVVEKENNGNNRCLQPCAVKCLKPFRKPAVESYSCDVAQPYAVKYQEEIVESANNDRDTQIQPYSVRYKIVDETAIDALDCVPAASCSSNNDVMTNPSSDDGNPPDLVSEERQHVPNVLHQNPIYVPNVQHPSACGKMRLSF
uniref:Uncharacterized protein n=1 Tax=Branchiostoma floridae TaxID=7739 RepID=C3XT91_BRAFL|eukprot:XP_002612815.1 hypothetical protein BRAFLDRAFT_82172 [Branchiostoma floridae]